MARRGLALCSVLVFLSGSSVFAQQPSGSGESHKYRTIFTIAGGGGGAAIGLFAGLSAFDDATNSESKVTTTAVLSGIGGAVGGYFLGRAIDRSKKNKTITEWPPVPHARPLDGRTYPSVESLGLVRPIPQIRHRRQTLKRNDLNSPSREAVRGLSSPAGVRDSNSLSLVPRSGVTH